MLWIAWHMFLVLLYLNSLLYLKFRHEGLLHFPCASLTLFFQLLKHLHMQ